MYWLVFILVILLWLVAGFFGTRITAWFEAIGLTDALFFTVCGPITLIAAVCIHWRKILNLSGPSKITGFLKKMYGIKS